MARGSAGSPPPGRPGLLRFERGSPATGAGTAILFRADGLWWPERWCGEKGGSPLRAVGRWARACLLRDNVETMKHWLSFLLVAGVAWGAEYRAGAAKVDITPKELIWLSGYASRNKPAEGTLQPLYAKALAIQDKNGARVVMVTTDLIGLSRTITEAVAARLAKEHGIERGRVVFNSSHTHTGPVIRANLTTMYNLSPEMDAKVAAYTRQLTEDLFTVAAGALGR